MFFINKAATMLLALGAKKIKCITRDIIKVAGRFHLLWNPGKRYFQKILNTSRRDENVKKKEIKHIEVGENIDVT